MQNYMTILDELKEETEKTRNRSWKWILFWRKDKSKDPQNSPDDPEQENLIELNEPDSPETPSKYAPELVMERRGSVWNGLPEERNSTHGFYRKVLNVIRVLERDDC